MGSTEVTPLPCVRFEHNPPWCPEPLQLQCQQLSGRARCTNAVSTLWAHLRKWRIAEFVRNPLRDIKDRKRLYKSPYRHSQREESTPRVKRSAHCLGLMA